MARPRVRALVAAAGRGSRFGGSRPKQYLRLAGKPLIRHALERLARHPHIDSILVVLAPGDADFEALEAGAGLPVERTDGGASRAESVLLGLHRLAEADDSGWVLVHDAARPCLPAAALDRLLDTGLGHPGGALLAVPLGDTLKRQGHGRTVEATVSRDGLWAAQTPQLFPLALLREALAAAVAAGVTITDESAAVERHGHRPLLVKGSHANIKVTWPEDLALAEAWLAREAAHA